MTIEFRSWKRKLFPVKLLALNFEGKFLFSSRKLSIRIHWKLFIGFVQPEIFRRIEKTKRCNRRNCDSICQWDSGFLSKKHWKRHGLSRHFHNISNFQDFFFKRNYFKTKQKFSFLQCRNISKKLNFHEKSVHTFLCLICLFLCLILKFR